MSETTIDPKTGNSRLDIIVARVLWRGRWWIGLFATLGALGGAAIALLQPDVFRAEALLQVRQLSGSAGNLGGLAALAGEFGDIAGGVLSLSSGTDRDVAIATLRSRTVVESLIQDKNLLPKIYESKWNSQAQAWKSSDADKQPTVWQAYNDFTRDVLRISEDRRTGLVTVAIDWKDPAEAQEWVTDLIGRTNAHLRERAIREGEKNLEYLRTQAQQIGQVELLQAVYGLVEEQLKQMMVANVGDDYALKTIDPAVVPKKRARPNRLLITFVSFLFGGALGVALAVVRTP